MAAVLGCDHDVYIKSDACNAGKVTVHFFLKSMYLTDVLELHYV